VIARKVSRVRIGVGAALALALSAVGVAVPETVSAAPWSIAAISDGVTAAQLAQTLVGPGVTVNSAAFSGDTVSGGLFDDSAASVGLASGIVLSTGDIGSVVGPNEFSDITSQLGQPGDAQLDALLPSGLTTLDAASLTVNFTPTNPQLAINYVFASEEYEEFVGSIFNDVFAFFVNGVNCALTPGTNDPITINTINPGSNALFYVPNEPPTYDTEFDGFTVVLTCRAAVNPGVPNTLKLVIADTSDQKLDSAVFLQANGISSNPLGPLQPITPNRLLDTRKQGALTAASSLGLSTETVVPAGQSITVKVTGGDVPETALAVALNVTAVDGQAPGFLTVWPTGGPQPGTSSVNFPPGGASPNTVVSRVGTGGSISIFASASVEVIVDIFGWFGPGGTARLFTVVPDRVFDSRSGAGPVGKNQTIDVQIAGTTRVPAGSTAAILNVTATDATAPGFLTVFPSDRAQPGVSSVNFEVGVARPNSVIAPVGADGKIKIFASERANVIVDVMGWFGAAGQSEYVEVPSTRVFDTRSPANGAAKLVAGGTAHVQIVGAVVPPNARSVVLNVTSTESDAPGFLTVYPGTAAQPPTSNVNYLKGQSIPNAVIVGLGPTGTVDIFSSSTSHVIVDVVGYFA
jgi:hypothetical protein